MVVFGRTGIISPVLVKNLFPVYHNLMGSSQAQSTCKPLQTHISANYKTPAIDDYRGFSIQAPTGFEPVIKVLQTSALPLGYGAIYNICKSLHAGACNVTYK